jgi:hypothetical protein
MKRDDVRDRISDMVAALGKAREFTAAMTLTEFGADEKSLFAGPSKGRPLKVREKPCRASGIALASTRAVIISLAPRTNASSWRPVRSSSKTQQERSMR